MDAGSRDMRKQREREVKGQLNGGIGSTFVFCWFGRIAAFEGPPP